MNKNLAYRNRLGTIGLILIMIAMISIVLIPGPTKTVPCYDRWGNQFIDEECIERGNGYEEMFPVLALMFIVIIIILVLLNTGFIP